jgi:hypothetical protein
MQRCVSRCQQLIVRSLLPDATARLEQSISTRTMQQLQKPCSQTGPKSDAGQESMLRSAEWELLMLCCGPQIKPQQQHIQFA